MVTVRSHDDVGFKHHAHGAHIVDLLADDLFRQPELGDAIHQHAARCVQRLEYVDLVSFLDEIARCGQAGGPMPTMATFLPVVGALRMLLISMWPCS